METTERKNGVNSTRAHTNRLLTDILKRPQYSEIRLWIGIFLEFSDRYRRFMGVGLGGLSMDDEILTIQEIAAFLKIKEKTAYDLAAKGRLPGFKVGGAWRFKRSALDQWIDEQTALAASSEGEDR